MNALVIIPAVFFSLPLQIGPGPIGPLFIGGKPEYNALATVEAVDADNRIVTVREKRGGRHLLHAGPKIKRFDELKVGEIRRFRANLPVVQEIRKAHEGVPQPPSERSAQSSDTGQAPAAAPNLSHAATVRNVQGRTILAELEDGSVELLEVEKKNKMMLKDVSEGSRVVISYQMAELTSIGRPVRWRIPSKTSSPEATPGGEPG